MGFRTACLLAFYVVAASAATSKSDQAWLADKADEPGVVATGTGLMYKVLVDGPTPGKSPKLNSKTVCNYEGALTDGSVFDSSYARGQTLTFKPKQVIAGWTEAMQLMKEGDTWELYIPSELGYGDSGYAGAIPGKAALVFKLEMIEVKGNEGTYNVIS
jgi:FKBP-type peptidyl-prolyl cis-trans isomerase FklB